MIFPISEIKTRWRRRLALAVFAPIVMTLETLACLLYVLAMTFGEGTLLFFDKVQEAAGEWWSTAKHVCGVWRL